MRRSLTSISFLASLLFPFASIAEKTADWSFDAEDTSTLSLVGEVRAGVPGPRRPDYPTFAQTNRALGLGGNGARVVVEDPGADSVFDFKNGDQLTLETWVRPDAIQKGENVYLIGKGRTDPKSSTPNNQNWALRLRETNGLHCPSFLFASPIDGGNVEWHRWTASAGLRHDNRWHHIAVSYAFGEPNSIKAFVDGKPVKGTWDMAGPTKNAPVVDDAPVWIGSSMGGNPGSSFRGQLDEIRLHRSLLSETELGSRFVTTLPAPAEPSLAEVSAQPTGNDVASAPKKPAKAVIPDLVTAPKIDWANIPPDRVTIEICEDWNPASNLWPENPLAATESYHAPAFGLFRVPHKYVETGVRAARNDPFLLRAFAKVNLPAGKHRILLRARGASVLFINDKDILRTPFPPPGTDDKPIKVQDNFLDLGGDFRFAPPGNRDAWCEFESAGGEHHFALETVVGYVLSPKSRRRPELGETVVAWSPDGAQTWHLAAPGTNRPVYSDTAWNLFQSAEETRLSAIDADARARARNEALPYWEKRRAIANQWLAEHPAPKVPTLPEGFPSNNPIDHFLAQKIASLQSQSTAKPAQGIDFWERIQPLLEARCLECHQGGKAKGGLHLDARHSALTGGKAEGPSIIPGNAAESPLLKRIRSSDEDEQMPPKGNRLSSNEIKLLEQWINEGAVWPEFRPLPTTLTPLTDDLTFLRRITLDTLGIVPSETEIKAFLADQNPAKRRSLIDRLLTDPRAADHGVGYWQDVLAENPNILNPTLNNTGPFRWWIHESLLDNKPLDLMVTELLHLGGSSKDGGPAGFGIASQNDVPLAAKATVVTTAFLGVETKCARCHDSPAHTSKQEQVFALAAMLNTKGVKVPATSSVSMKKLREGGRKPLIDVTLEPGATVEPVWPFPDFVDPSLADSLAQNPDDTRDRLAALLTAPQNERFAQVMANRIWARLMGRGIVDQPWDWERSKNSHPDLLRWLGHELVKSGYDARHLAKLILNSHAYQRANDPALKQPSPLFTAPAARRLTAEQIVDSAFVAAGKSFRTEEASLDIDSIRDTGNSVTLGHPSRAWMLTSTSNERDRPSLALPRIQAVCDVLHAFGWRSSRPDPLTERESAPNSLQPAILGNGTMGLWLTRLSEDHAVTQIALESTSPDEFVTRLFLRVLTRKPRPDEQSRFISLLAQNWEQRKTPPQQQSSVTSKTRKPAYYVSWSNHLDADATIVRQAQEADSRRGDAPTPRLAPGWRAQAEDALWALLNSPEFLFTP
jgi:mono/diheme cytochrome c family protein